MSYRKWKNLSNTPTYKSWSSMINRCVKSIDPHHKKYYSDTGVCERWLSSYDDFVDDVGFRPPGTSLDRWPDKRGRYEPGNVRWATHEQQTNNAKQNIVLAIGMFTGTVAEWGRALKRPYREDKTIYSRLEKGWTPYEALFTPIVQGVNQFTVSERAQEPGA
jgi:hypothetical protein